MVNCEFDMVSATSPICYRSVVRPSAVSGMCMIAFFVIVAMIATD